MRLLLFFILFISFLLGTDTFFSLRQDAVFIKLKTEQVQRDSILKNLKGKISKGEPLVVHMLVPLCDNENQGIVPVNANLGNGMNLNTNLYWGAAYGVRSYFKKRPDWKLLKSISNPNLNVLERIVFQKEFSNGAKVIFIADAYRGDRMKECLLDYFNFLAGKKNDCVKDQAINVCGGSDADLIIFNGHNGLMDVSVDAPIFSGRKNKEAAAIGCYSFSYFKNHFTRTNSYPTLTTTHLMAPEAYVAEALINNWALLSNESTIRSEVAKAYHTFQKCGMKGAMNLFKSGW